MTPRQRGRDLSRPTRQKIYRAAVAALVELERAGVDGAGEAAQRIRRAARGHDLDAEVAAMRAARGMFLEGVRFNPLESVRAADNCRIYANELEAFAARLGKPGTLGAGRKVR